MHRRKKTSGEESVQKPDEVEEEVVNEEIVSDERDKDEEKVRPAEEGRQDLQNDWFPALLSLDWPAIPFILFVLTLATRFWRLEEPRAVVFDEFHFGNFVNHYFAGEYVSIGCKRALRGSFWIGKLTLVFAGWLFGYDPETCGYEHIHYKYGPDCNFVVLRATAALFGCITVPFLYSCARRLGSSWEGAVVTCVLFMLDNLNLIESRLVLVDSQLMFYMVLALWVGLCYFERRREAEDAYVMEKHGVKLGEGKGGWEGIAGEGENGAERDVAEVMWEQESFDAPDTALDAAARGYGTLGWRLPQTFENGTKAAAREAAVVGSRLRAIPGAWTSFYIPLAPGANVAAGAGVPRQPRHLSLWERVWWSIALGTVCGLAMSIKWTALATPGIIAVECFFGFFFLREAVDIPDLLLMGFSSFVVYATWVYIHFQMLPNSGDGDGFMPIEFQRTLINNTYYDPDAPKVSFWYMLFELSREMLSANSRILTEHHWMSKWYTWPLNQRGVLYFSDEMANGWQRLVYLVANPFAAWIALAFVAIAASVLLAWNHIRRVRGVHVGRDTRAGLAPLAFCVTVYALNLLPYIAVARSAFIYHYMPALLYAEITTGILISRLPDALRATAAKVVILTVFLGWVHFSPWVYAFPVLSDAHARRRWLKGWD